MLVFGAIQRVCPDFFPSFFTEKRQNLLLVDRQEEEGVGVAAVGISGPKQQAGGPIWGSAPQVAKILKAGKALVMGGARSPRTT